MPSPSQNRQRSFGHSRDASTATLVGAAESEHKPDTGYHHRPSSRYQPSMDGGRTEPDYESIPMTSLSVSGGNDVVDQAKHLATPHDRGQGRFWDKWPKHYRWLFFNGIVSFLWGIALAIFCAGLVPWHWNISQFAQKFDREYTNEVAALVGSICKLHITYVLQQALELYSRIVLAGEFTLKDLKWMQGVNEETIFAEFPDRPGAPPRLERSSGIWGRVKGWWWSVYRFCSTMRLSWIVLWIGLLLHNTAIVSILQPEEMWQHFPFNDPVPCGIAAGLVTLEPERFLTEDQQQVFDKMSFEIGLQLGNYVDQVSGNTTTAVAGRKYRKDNFAYGGIGGLIEGLQDIPGVQYTAQCTKDMSKANDVWQSALAGLSPPEISTNFNQFTNIPIISAASREVTSHPSLSFSISMFESAMYAVVDPLGNGAFVALSKSSNATRPATLFCSRKTEPKLLHIEMVNFTALVLGHDPAEEYPSLTGRATLATLQGMAQATRLGATIHLDSLKYLRQDVTWESGPSYTFQTNSTAAQIVQTILADGGKASMAKYNAFSKRVMQQSNGQLALCNSKNKTVATHWRFGNNKRIGWIAVIWTIGMGVLGMGAAVWMSKKERSDVASPLGAAGGFVLAVGEHIPDDQPLVIKHGKVGYARIGEEDGMI